MSPMNAAMILLLAVGAVVAEPAFRRQQAQQAAPQDGQEAEGYAPSGWKPAGQRLELPKQYGAPSREEEADATTETPTEEPAPDVPATPKTPKSQKQEAAPAPQYQGEYYVILPDGRLQRVQFAASVEQQQQQQQQQQQAAAPQQPAVPQTQYFVVLPDGRLQEVELSAKSEERKQDDQDADDEAAAEEPAPVRPNRPVPRPVSRPQSAQRRPQPEKVQQQQRPVVLMPQQPLQPLQPLQPQQQDVPASFVAELRYMEVPPITGPVFSYSSPLVRVQRQA